ncbi:MAG: TIGR02757 family protein [Desulfamplus sp.]|nr:TIGR02757 family protein [Desulfamplus sp.]
MDCDKKNYDKDKLCKQLEYIYSTYNKKEYIHPDPLEFLYHYPDPKDREIAALIASSLAYGRVDQILKHVGLVFQIMGKSLYEYLMQNSEQSIVESFKEFRYRFTNFEHISSFLIGIKATIEESGSLKKFFLSAIREQDENIIPALTRFVKKITEKGNCGNLAPNPEKGSACKRNNLFLRWMIRKDDVDPGGWDEIPSSMLIVPLDTHMHHAGKILGFTKRAAADMKTALEITAGFRQICPDDPIKYDFSLTRFGIHPDMDFSELEVIVSSKI